MVDWDNRYIENNTPWDIGYISTPIKEYLDKIEDKSLEILIPGAGNAYEAEYMHQSGFTNVYICDLSITAIKKFQNRVPDFPSKRIIIGDFFEINGSFDLIIEQTFFCAIAPSLRLKYRDTTFQLLKKGGKLLGLFFGLEFEKKGPPFGGSKEEYYNLFSKKYCINLLEPCLNSIPSRKGLELFFEFQKN